MVRKYITNDKKILRSELLMGINDVDIVLHYLSDNRNDKIALSQVYEFTKQKRRWSVINPGYILQLTYGYLVNFESMLSKNQKKSINNNKSVIEKFNQVEILQAEKELNVSDKIKKIRNAVSHGNFELYIKNDSLDNDSDFYFYLWDEYKINLNCEIVIPLMALVNISIELGAYLYYSLKELEKSPV